MSGVKNTFLIDIDGVACDHARGICKTINTEFGLSSKVDDVTTWDHDFGCITFVEAVKKYYPDSNFIKSLEVYSDFTKFLRLIEPHSNIEFATNRVDSWEATESWITDNFGAYKIHFVKDKTELKYDFLIDDHPDIIIKSAEMGKVSFLIERPWNRDQDTINKINNMQNAYFISRYDQALNLISPS